MPLSLFEKIIEKVAPLTEQVCLHLLGEPLLHPELDQILDSCLKHHSKVFLVTNGMRLDALDTKTLLHPSLRQINFSLHSFSDNFPNRSPDDYLKHIFDYTRLAFTERPDLYINYRLWNQKTAENFKLIDAHKYILKKIEESFDVTISECTHLKKQKSTRILNKLYLHYDTEFIWPALDLDEQSSKGTCLGLKSHFGILADGTVVPCCLDRDGVIALGNLQTTTIEEILHSKRAQEIKKGFQDRRLLEPLCKRCNYVRRFD